MKKAVDDADAGSANERRKKGKRANAKNVHLQRVNFLVAAAELMASVCPNVSRGYIKELKEISEKHVIRLDVGIKRLFCKGCNTLLIPGKTALVRMEYHGTGCREVPGTEIEHWCTSETAETAEVIDGNTSSDVLDEKQIKWLAVTCCICTRTRRIKPQHADDLHSESPALANIQ